MCSSTHLPQRAEAEAEDLVVQDGGGADPQLHTERPPHKEEVVVGKAKHHTRTTGGGGGHDR